MDYSWKFDNHELYLINILWLFVIISYINLFSVRPINNVAYFNKYLAMLNSTTITGLLIFTTVSYAGYKLYKKAWGNPPLNKYDDKDQIASIPGHCLFCKIIHTNKEPFYRDDKVVAFYDKYPIGRIHIQIVPLRHIKNVWHLKRSDIELIEHMRQVGERLLRNIDPNGEYVFGFHHPLCNSIPHLHMHAIVLPLKSWSGKVEISKPIFITPEKVIAKLAPKEKIN
ncbi:unnamed protein product [Blepharisma stoltei]|uniref:HIT domain-containing protein n=1 Tax=Blepharisma stoltei TaxID=1481888 RepID=A0AAU9ISL0_9CILI|nr:unnamed protein product [Blepharisma stoltei]